MKIPGVVQGLCRFIPLGKRNLQLSGGLGEVAEWSKAPVC